MPSNPSGRCRTGVGVKPATHDLIRRLVAASSMHPRYRNGPQMTVDELLNLALRDLAADWRTEGVDIPEQGHVLPLGRRVGSRRSDPGSTRIL